MQIPKRKPSQRIVFELFTYYQNGKKTNKIKGSDDLKSNQVATDLVFCIG